MQVNGNTPINLTLSVDAVNVVLSSLSAQPYERVAGIIGSIQQQAQPQVAATSAGPQEETDASS